MSKKFKYKLKEQIDFISFEDFLDNYKLYQKGDIDKTRVISSYNRLKSEDQIKAKPYLKTIKEDLKENKSTIQDYMKDLDEMIKLGKEFIKLHGREI